MKNLLKIFVLLFIVVSTSVKTKAQTPITICPDQASFSSMTRGYYFTAPTTFTICGLFVEDDRSTSSQSVEIVRFTAGPPPAYSATTNSFVSLFYQNNYVPNNMIAVPNITINAGDVIGIYGSRAATNSYGAAQCPVTIQGFPVTLFRSGMQFNLATQQMHDIWNENNGRIGRVTMFTNCCPNPIAIPNISGPITVCEGNSATYTVPAQTGAVSYDWTVPAGATITSGQGNTSINVTWNTATPPDSICVTWTDACSTSAPTCLGVTVNPIPTPPTAANISICPNNSATLTATAPGGNYDWYDSAIGGTLLASGNSFTTPNLPVNTTYYVESTVNGCTSPRTPVTVTISTNMTIDAGINDSICFGGNHQLQVSPNGVGYTYLWDEISSPAFSTIYNPIVSPTSTTTYFVNVIGPTGCSGSDTVIINVIPQLIATMGVVDVTCNASCDGQSSVVINGGLPPYQYNWASGGTNSLITNLCPNLYSVTVTDVFGCTTTGDTTVSEPAIINPAIDSSANPLCNGDCNGSIAASSIGGTGVLDFSIDGINFQSSGTFNNLCAGNYTITVQDNNLCQATIQTSLTDPQLLVVNNISTNDAICNGGASGTINITATGGTGAITYSIDNGVTFTNSSNFNGLNAGSYSIIVQDSNLCSVNAGIVDILEPLPLSIPNTITDVGCFGGNDGWISVSPQGGTNPYTFLWSNGTTLPLASNLIAGNYTITVTDFNGCFLDSTFSMNEPAPINFVTFNTDTLTGCVPLDINFYNTTDPNLVSNSFWDFGDGTTSTSNSPLHTYSNPGNYDVTLTITDTGSCVGFHTETSYIHVFDLPTAEFNMDPLTSSMFDPTINFFDQSYFNIVNWNWNFGGTGTSTDQNPTYTFPSDTGNYTILLTIEDDLGCINSTTEVITITGEYGIYLPNAFTPDENGNNDVFKPVGFGITNKNYSFKIYNRWGEKFFESQNPNIGWDGTSNGKFLPNDVYIWNLSFTDINGEIHQKIGKVSIIK